MRGDGRLRVAMVAPMLLPVPPRHSGGTERIVADLVGSVVNLGWVPTLFGPLDADLPCEVIGPAPSISVLRERHDRVPGATLAVLEAALLDMVRVRAGEFDVIHCHTEFAHAAVLGEHRARTLTTIHWRCDELDRQLFFEAFPDLPVAAISADQGMSIPAGNLRGIVPHGIAGDRYRAGPGGRGLAFLGRMTDQKRPERAIELARRTGRPLTLAGTVDPGNPTHFRRHVEPHLSETIRFVGELDDQGKQTLLGEADAFVMPIDWPEPFGIVMVEAMACGTPVIAWARGAAPETVEQGVTGFLVEDMDEAVRAVGRLHEIDRRVVRQTFERRFTADRMANDYIKLYRELAGS